MKELINDQAFLVMFPIVALGILVAIASAYFLWKERREGRAQHTANKLD